MMYVPWINAWIEYKMYDSMRFKMS